MSLRAAYLNLGSFFGVAIKETLFPNSQIKTVAAERMAEKSSNLYLIPSATTWTCQFSALASKKNAKSSLLSIHAFSLTQNRKKKRHPTE